MRARGNEIRVRQRQLAGALCTVGKQQRTGPADFIRKPVERLDHARFVIDLLNRDQRRSVGQHGIERSLVDDPIATDVDNG